jgi:cell wall-associated NlpC family hydrolase
MMVCYELPIYAAAHGGVLTPQQLWNLVHAFDGVGRGSAASIMKALTSSWSMRWTFDQTATVEKMQRGDIVFFNGVGHVAVALGNSHVVGQIASVWGMNPVGIQPNTAIEVTTVATVLGQIAVGAPGLAQVVTYSSPTW